MVFRKILKGLAKLLAELVESSNTPSPKPTVKTVSYTIISVDGDEVKVGVDAGYNCATQTDDYFEPIWKRADLARYMESLGCHKPIETRISFTDP